MLKVYIADDEEVVRQGLKNIIDWEGLGFDICGEASNGLVAYNDIKKLLPDLILVDIRMPKLQGLDLASQLREDGFTGHIIVLSGYSEFKYAQEAIRCDVDYYLTKPIEEEELYTSVQNIKNLIQKQQIHTEHHNYYQEKAKAKIIEDMMKIEGKSLATLEYSLGELNLDADQYQVLIIQQLSEGKDVYTSLCEALKVPTRTNMIEQLSIEKYRVILLKGELIIGRFAGYRKDFSAIEENISFIAVGRVVAGINEIYYSYHEALAVFERQFFLDRTQHIVELSELPSKELLTYMFSAQHSKEIGKKLYNYIVIFRKKECMTYLEGLKEQLIYSKNSTESMKSFLAGVYIYIVQEFKRNYSNYEPNFLTNAEIIEWFHECLYLEDTLEFMTEEVHRLVQLIGGFSSDSIVDEIIDYIQHHYDEDIKLKRLAPKFGYNSSYLGKIFSKKMDVGFNDYLHQVRTNRAKTLLLDQRYKVYEISALVGYKNVDYFHLKFKQFEGTTPNDYRIKHHVDVETTE